MGTENNDHGIMNFEVKGKIGGWRLWGCRSVAFHGEEVIEDEGDEHDEEGGGEPVEGITEGGGVIGVGGIAELAEEEAVGEAEGTEADIEGEAAEAKDGGAVVGIDLGVQVVRGEEIEEAEGEGKDHEDDHAVVGDGLGGDEEADEAEGGDDEVVSGDRLFFDEAFCDAGGDDAERGEDRAEDAEGGVGDFDEAVVFRIEGEEEADDGIVDEGGENDGEDHGCFPDPGGGAEDAGPERGFAGVMGILRGFLHGDRDDEGEAAGEEGEVDGEAEGLFLGDLEIAAEGGEDAVDEVGVVYGGADEHGDDEGDGGEAHEIGEDFGPKGLAVFFGEGVVGEGFIGAGGGGFGGAGEDAVEDPGPEDEAGVPEGDEGDECHLEDHEHGRCNDHAFATDFIGEGAGGDFEEDDGDGPDEIEERELLHGEAVIELEDGEDGVVEARVEEEAKGDEEPDVFGHIVRIVCNRR